MTHRLPLLRSARPRPAHRVLAWAAILASLLPAGALADRVLDDFQGDASAWKPELFYGDVSRCRASGEGGALRVDFDLAGKDTNHILFARGVDADLSWSDSISFQVKGAGDQALVFLFLYDSKGSLRNYGPHGSNADFHTGYADWHTCRVDLEKDRSVQGGDADLGNVRRVGFFVWSMGPKKGTVWFRNLSMHDRDGAGALTLSPSEFTPNGDGICDTARIRTLAPRDSALTLEVLDPAGQVVETLLRDVPQVKRGNVVAWDGKAKGRQLPGGQYTIRARFTGTGASDASPPRPEELTQKVALRKARPWSALRYRQAPFFPIGAWFEGAPSYNGCPTDPAGARAYCDRHFAILARNGFSAVAVPNCPEAQWEILLQAAQKHGIRVCLEVAPLVALVSQSEPATERQVQEAVKRVVDKIGKYDSLLRYQVRDEPPPGMVPNWILVQRALAALDPRRPAFSCFCDPSSLANLSGQTRLTEAVFDIYPHWAGTPRQSLGGFLGTLGSFKAAAKGNPMWAVLQAFGISHATGSWRYPTPEELRAVTYLSLAEGATGVFYFIYSHMPGYLDGLVAADGTPQPLFRPTAKLAGELQKLSPLLLSLKPDRTPAKAEGDARAGRFTDRRGRAVLIVASTRPDAAVTARLDGVPGDAWEDALTRERLRAAGGMLEVPLGPGCGRVLVAR